MYLTKLFRQNKLWFLIVILFAFGQLFINYKDGVECSPFFHYGMFSMPFRFQPSYQTTEVTINGKRLQSKDFSPNGWDNIVIPITQWQAQQPWNSGMYNATIKRLLHVNDSSLYTNQLSQADFDNWYKARVTRLLKLQDTAADVQYRIVTYKQENNFLRSR